MILNFANGFITLCMNRKRDFQTINLKVLRARKPKFKFCPIFCHMNHIYDWKYALFQKISKTIFYPFLNTLKVFRVTCHHQN